MVAENIDPRLHRSRAALIEAIAGLVRERPVEEISITDVSKAAGVTRPTFYQHFEDMPSAVRAAAIDQLAAAYPPVKAPSDKLTSEQMQKALEDRATSVLEHLWQDREFYHRVLDGAGNAELFDAFVDIVSDRMMPLTVQKIADRDLKLMLAGGVMWIVVKWLRAEKGSVRPRAMARRLVKLILQMEDA